MWVSSLNVFMWPNGCMRLSSFMWLKVAKSGDFMWLSGFKWISGFMWQKVGKVRKSGEKR